MKRDPEIEIPEEDLAKIRAAAESIMFKLPAMVDLNPQYVLGALALATGYVAAMLKTSYVDLMGLISSYYENALLDELRGELAKDGLTMPPKINESN